MRKNSRRHKVNRFRPAVDLASDGATVLDRRLMLSADSARAARAAHRAVHVEASSHSRKHNAASERVTPAEEINNQYAQFSAAFQSAVVSYTGTLNQTSTGTVSVVTTLTAAYTAGSASMVVNNAAVFGPEGTYPNVVDATAFVGNVSVGQVAILGSSGNTLAIQTSGTTTPSLAAGTALTALVPTSASNSAATIFPSFITANSQQLAVKLVSYFNSLPFKLPRMFAFPHQDARSGALQQYVFQIVAGAASTSLEQTLIAVTLPQTPGGDLQIYQSAVAYAINASRLQMLDGVQQIFSGKLQVVPTSLSSSSSSSTAGTSSTSTTGTGSSSST
jgi:hypothetical protein